MFFINAIETHLCIVFTEEFLRSARADRFKLLKREITGADIKSHAIKVKTYMSVREHAYRTLARQLKNT